MCVFARTCVIAHLWRSEDVQKSALFYRVDPKYLIHVFRLGGQCLCQLSLLTAPFHSYKAVSQRWEMTP